MTSIRQHTHYPEAFPLSWATGWGEDEFGLWMAFSYKGQRQQFRWCEPGTFLMGSPEDEPERLTSETQHEVTLSKGFWVADTVVTQGLWEAVMNDNPSNFKGESLPVETVSWDDTQMFIGALNRMKPELKLCLLTETQWEYACRAGSTTPFCWGEQINSELVNFNGIEPYNKGRKSKFRESTVDVKSFHQNNWGLWQMHGNVWEWCLNRYETFSIVSITNPEGPKSGSYRVLRGGAWTSIGRYCRSAYRNRNSPDYLRNDVGFRLALSHE